MGTKVPRALIATLLIAGIFSSPFFASLSYAEEIATSTPETLVEVVPEVVTKPEATTTIEVVTESASAPTQPEAATSSITTTELVVTEDVPSLPTGVLLDSSLSDESWNLNVYTDGHYLNFFNGYSALGIPPILSSSYAWVSTGTTTVARIKKAGTTTCDQLSYGATGGLSMYGPTYIGYDTIQRFTREVGDYCDFYFVGEGIPPGTPLSAILIGAYGTTTIAGSRANTGTSTNGFYENPISGGFAFQLCGIDGCSGGFATSTATTTPQVSNVLFLPGIKGSRLYDAVGNKVWEPGSDQDVEKIFLTPAGVSANLGVHAKSGDIIETIAGFSEIYGSFMRSMNELQSTKKIKEWRIASYDWRLSLDDIVNKGAVREGNIYFDEAADIPYLELNLRELASSSPTHKVTIIAHSNGGLVAKKLMLKLGNAETARLIDKVIFVGVPQSGAPQALGALLFGYKESLPSWFPFIVHIPTARTFAENSPMGYHLLPSQKYFNDVLDKEHAVVRFTAASTYAEERTKYGNIINTWEELRAFSLAEDKGRVKPEPILFFKPNVLNDFLLTYAKNTHDAIDAWVPPTGVTLYQIGGWGVDTVSGVEFYELCVLSICKKEYRPTFVEDGDGVVPIPSALMTSTSVQNVKRYWLDLSVYGIGGIGRKDHGSLFDVEALRAFIEATIDGTESLPKNIYREQPETNKLAKKLRFMLHSPLTLNLYDSSGNHVGPVAGGDSEETIPGSEYGQFGEVQYIIVPAGPEYKVKMNGIAPGTFSLDIQEVSGGSVVASTTLANIPTQTGTIATITIGESLATVSSLSVDSDGNGSTDILLPVTQDSTTFYQAPVEAVTAPTSSSGSSSRSSTISPAPETVSINSVPPSALLTTPVAQQLAKKVTQVAGVIQKEPVVATQPKVEILDSHNSSQLASPLSAFYGVKDILISMLVGVYHFIIRIGSFLFTR